MNPIRSPNPREKQRLTNYRCPQMEPTSHSFQSDPKRFEHNLKYIALWYKNGYGLYLQLNNQIVESGGFWVWITSVPLHIEYNKWAYYNTNKMQSHVFFPLCKF